MKIVIFAGGTGKRLWPLSKENSPKQFQKLFNNETTLENSYNTIKSSFNINDIFISTGKDYIDQVYKAIPELPKENVIIEPMSRDTGPAVAYAMLRISQKFPDEPVVIRWQNSLIKNTQAFMNALSAADNIFKKDEAELVYLAVPSRYPNTGVGHIKLGSKIKEMDNVLGLFQFDGFVEKPNKELAEKYHSEGIYAWNPGCYITTPRFILTKLESKSPDLYKNIQTIQESLGKEDEWETIYNEFKKMEKKSIDYVLWEKLDHDGIKVVLAEYQWFYVSTWTDLKNALQDVPLGNVIKGKVETLDSKNCLIYNYDDKKLVTVIGLEGIEIINVGDSILICNQNSAGKVKDLVNGLEKNDELRKHL